MFDFDFFCKTILASIEFNPIAFGIKDSITEASLTRKWSQNNMYVC